MVDDYRFVNVKLIIIIIIINNNNNNKIGFV